MLHCLDTTHSYRFVYVENYRISFHFIHIAMRCVWTILPFVLHSKLHFMSTYFTFFKFYHTSTSLLLLIM